MVEFLCSYLSCGLCNSVFSKILLVPQIFHFDLPRYESGLVVNGIRKKKRYILLEETLVIFVCTYLAKGALQFCSLKNSFDNHISASDPWNRSKFHIKYAYSKR